MTGLFWCFYNHNVNNRKLVYDFLVIYPILTVQSFDVQNNFLSVIFGSPESQRQSGFFGDEDN